MGENTDFSSGETSGFKSMKSSSDLMTTAISSREASATRQAFREFQAARRTIQGYEAIHMIRKGQVRWVAGDDLLRQIQFIDSLFDLAA
jgi:hypothetical protein